MDRGMLLRDGRVYEITDYLIDWPRIRFDINVYKCKTICYVHDTHKEQYDDTRCIYL